MPTLKDVAALAGVSAATVSLYLNGKSAGRISQQKQKEIEEQKKAETILQTLDGMSIASAKELLNKCEQCLGTLIIRSCECPQVPQK